VPPRAKPRGASWRARALRRGACVRALEATRASTPRWRLAQRRAWQSPSAAFDRRHGPARASPGRSVSRAEAEGRAWATQACCTRPTHCQKTRRRPRTLVFLLERAPRTRQARCPAPRQRSRPTPARSCRSRTPAQANAWRDPSPVSRGGAGKLPPRCFIVWQLSL
jgi:hypothetical protein